ncbi:hypothetical protein LCGC14_0940390 [marine sediment metagenome]|uniref:Uncharacterized protein n=1 Tax=marine sediment metagenome TaxID=412755 RepID=A0A0F9R3Y1_9ZZZZ
MKNKSDILKEYWKPSSPEVREGVYRALRLEIEVDKRDGLRVIAGRLNNIASTLTSLKEEQSCDKEIK